MIVRKHPGKQRPARRRAKRNGRISPAKTHALSGNAINRRRLTHRIAIKPQRIIALHIGKQKKDIGSLCIHRINLLIICQSLPLRKQIQNRNAPIPVSTAPVRKRLEYPATGIIYPPPRAIAE